MMGKIFYLILSGVIIISIYNNAAAYDDKITHPDITINSIRNSKLDAYLKNNLGFKDGIQTKIPSTSKNDVLFLLRKGSELEDLEACRRANHMHNPLLPWDVSYMSDEPWWAKSCYLVWGRKYSNITWATGFISKDGTAIARRNQEMGWDNARIYFYNALTSESNTERETYFAETFQALGQVMHLLQDMAVPAHTRNDFMSHLMKDGFFSWFYQPFERYVKSKPNLVSTAGPVSPNFTITRLTDFWDTDQYPLFIGLSEFSNANYLSDATIPANNPTPEHRFANPNIDNDKYQICEDYAPDSTTVKIKYVSRKDKSGCDYFAVVNALNPLSYMNDINYLNANIAKLKLTLDDNVHKTYAKELIPRAVGYSAGLLNYFFRGEINMVDDEKTGSGYVIENNSEEDMNGTFELWYDAKDGNRKSAWSGFRSMDKKSTGNNKSTNITFNSPTDIKEKGKYILVFRGKMGRKDNAGNIVGEEGAVIGRRVELKSEFIFLVSPRSLIQEYLKYSIFALKYFVKDGAYQIKSADSGKIFEVGKNIFAKNDATFYGGDSYTQYGNANPLIQSRPDKGEHVIILPDKYSPWINGFGVGRVKYGGWQGWRWVDHYYLMGTRFGYRPKDFTENAEYIFSAFDNGNKGSTFNGKNLAAIGRRNFTLNNNKNALVSFDNFIYGDSIKNTNFTESNGNGFSTYAELIKSYKISNRSAADLEIAKDDTKSTTVDTWFYTPVRQEGNYTYLSKITRMYGTKAEGVSNSIVSTLDENNAISIKTEYKNQKDYGAVVRSPGIMSIATAYLKQASYPIGEVYQGTEGRGDTNMWNESLKKTLNEAKIYLIVGSTIVENLENKKEAVESVYEPFNSCNNPGGCGYPQCMGFYSDYLLNEKTSSLAIMDYDNQYGAENIILFYNIDTIGSNDNIVATWQSSNDKNYPLSSATSARNYSNRATSAFYLYYKIGGKTEKIQLEALKTDTGWTFNGGILTSCFAALSWHALAGDDCSHNDYTLTPPSPSNPPKTIIGKRITGVSSQINDKNMVYTYIVEEYKEVVKPPWWQGTIYPWTFVRRVIGIINISDERLPVGYRQEFEITDANEANIFGEQYRDQNGNVIFYYKSLAAIGVHSD